MMNNKRYICPACYTNQEQGDGYCDNCGTELEMIRYCNSCGVEATSRSKFCRECGEALPAITKASPAVAPRKAEPPNKPSVQPVWMNPPVQAPAPVAPVIPQAAPPQRAAPTAMSAATPDSLREINRLHLAIVSVLGLLAFLSVLNGNVIFGIIAFVIIFNIGGANLAHVLAYIFNKIIDWMWDSPVMRRRFLGE